MNDMTELASSIDKEKAMEGIFELMTLNAEAECRCEDIFEKLKKEISHHEVIKEDLEKKMQEIKVAICHGRNYTGKLDGEIVTFEEILALYSDGKKKKVKNARKSEVQKNTWNQVTSIRAIILNKAGAIYRRWVEKLFPADAITGSTSTALVAADDGTESVAESQTDPEPFQDQESGSDAESVASETAPDLDPVPESVNSRMGGRRVVVQTPRFVPGDGEVSKRRSVKRGRSDVVQQSGPRKRVLLGTPEREALDDTASPVFSPTPVQEPYVIFIDTDDATRTDPTQDNAEIPLLLKVPRKVGRVEVTVDQIEADLHDYKINLI
jgi:hypothetical protein